MSKILIVDDNRDARLILEAVLKRGGYRVSIAEDGVEAMERISQENPSLILLDIMMPKIDGFQICQEIKGNAETRNIPVLMITARKDPESRQRGLEVGASDYMVKPLHPAEILNKVRQYLGDDRTPPPSLKTVFLPLLFLREILLSCSWFRRSSGESCLTPTYSTTSKSACNEG